MDKIPITERELGSSNAPAVSGSLQTSGHQHMGVPMGHLGNGDKGHSKCNLLIDGCPLLRAVIPHYFPSNFLCDLCHRRCFVHHRTTCSSDSLPVLKMISLRYCLETPSPPSYSSFSVNPFPVLYIPSPSTMPPHHP